MSMEMFERDVQPVLDDYLAGRIPESAMLAKSRPWGNYRVGYREIVEFAKAKGYPVIAANIPRRLASSLARKGKAALEELSDTERAYVARETSAPEAATWPSPPGASGCCRSSWFWAGWRSSPSSCCSPGTCGSDRPMGVRRRAGDGSSAVTSTRGRVAARASGVVQ